MSKKSVNKRSRKYRRRRRRRILFGVEIFVLVLLGVGLFGYMWLNNVMERMRPEELDTSKIQVNSEVQQNIEAMSGSQIIAVAGLDARGAAIDPEDDVKDLRNSQNSDTIILVCIDHDNKEIRMVSIMRDTWMNMETPGQGYDFAKANSAYNRGGPEAMLSMLNTNLDLNITEYVTVDFTALTKTIDLLGGIDIDLTREEVIHINNYNRGDDEATGTAEASGVEYEALEVPPEEESGTGITHTYHLNGSQAVSYARIRYTAGNDFRRASRQRLVLAKIMEKAQGADLGTLDAILGEVLPLVTTNLQNTQIISMVQPLLTYSLTEDSQTGFPFVLITDSGGELTGEDCIIPVTLEYNVQRLHEFLFPGESYTPSSTVQEYSAEIEYETGYSEEDIEDISSIDWGANLSQWTGE